LTWPKDKDGQGLGGRKGSRDGGEGGGGGGGPRRSASLQKLIDIVALAAADSWR